MEPAGPEPGHPEEPGGPGAGGAPAGPGPEGPGGGGGGAGGGGGGGGEAAGGSGDDAAGSSSESSSSEGEEEGEGPAGGAGGPPALGCKHYRRGCAFRAPCCGEVFTCRHCHNEAKNDNEPDPKKRHILDRKQIELLVCLRCGEADQPVAEACRNCGERFAEYSCLECRFFDDDLSKQPFHCDGCGICRVGGRENFFHCDRCGCCYDASLQDEHICVEQNLHSNCPICFEYLFDSVKSISVLKCGHTMHEQCLKAMLGQLKTLGDFKSCASCPTCNKTVADLSAVWEQLDMEIATNPMPDDPKLPKTVHIRCNDCEEASETTFHFAGLKCLHEGCGSYNTHQTGVVAQ